VGLLKGINDESEQSVLLGVVPSNVTVVPSFGGDGRQVGIVFSSG
jgi:hypothetical protein